MSGMHAQAVRQEEMDAKEAEMLAQQAARELEWKEQQAARQAEMDAKEAEMIAKEEAWDKKIQAQNAAIEKRERDQQAALHKEPILTTEQKVACNQAEELIKQSTWLTGNSQYRSIAIVETAKENTNKWESDIWYELAVFSNQVGISKNDQVLLIDIVKRYVK
jgi:hypothetical protein